MAVYRKSDRRRDDLCVGVLRNCSPFCASRARVTIYRKDCCRTYAPRARVKTCKKDSCTREDLSEIRPATDFVRRRLFIASQTALQTVMTGLLMQTTASSLSTLKNS